MLMTTKMIVGSLTPDYESPACRLQRLVRDGKYIPVVRGLYETDPDTPGHLLATAIRSPSYLSFEWALSYHGLIPEGVVAYTSATCATRHGKVYTNAFGRYHYRDVPKDAFPFGTGMIRERGYTWWLASSEKALCDELYIKPAVRSLEDMRDMLFEDLRIYEDGLLEMDKEKVSTLAEKYRCSNVRLFAKLMERGFRCLMILNTRRIRTGSRRASRHARSMPFRGPASSIMQASTAVLRCAYSTVSIGSPRNWISRSCALMSDSVSRITSPGRRGSCRLWDWG